jgi:hypothetical protein
MTTPRTSDYIARQIGAPPVTDPDETIPHSDTADALEQEIPITDEPEDDEEYPRADEQEGPETGI